MIFLRHKDFVTKYSEQFDLPTWLVDAVLTSWYEDVAQELLSTGTCALGDLGEMVIYEVNGVILTRWLNGNGKRWERREWSGKSPGTKNFNNRRL